MSLGRIWLIVSVGRLRVSILGPLLFLVYISDLHSAIKYCKVNNFAGDTNLMTFQASIKKQINHDHKSLSN